MLDGIANAGLGLPVHYPDHWIVDCKSSKVQISSTRLAALRFRASFICYETGGDDPKIRNSKSRNSNLLQATPYPIESGIENVAERVAQQVDTQHRHENT